MACVINVDPMCVLKNVSNQTMSSEIDNSYVGVIRLIIGYMRIVDPRMTVKGLLLDISKHSDGVICEDDVHDAIQYGTGYNASEIIARTFDIEVLRTYFARIRV